MLTEVAMPVADPNMHWHDDGTEHSHEAGTAPHTHDESHAMLDENGNGIDDMLEPKA